jgi:hypothetical protein
MEWLHLASIAGVGALCDDAGIAVEGEGDKVLAVGVKAFWKV